MEPALKDIGYLLDTSIVCETVLEECSFASVSPVHITAHSYVISYGVLAMIQVLGILHFRPVLSKILSPQFKLR